MHLAHGGHLTHGSPASFSGRFFTFSHYGVDKTTGRIDYDEVDRIARRVRPKMIVAGASAYPRIIDFEAFSNIARSVGALLMVDMAHIAGLVAAGLHPSPVLWADAVTSTTHKTLRGPRGGLILARAAHKGALDKEIFPGIQGGPLMHVIAAKAVVFKEALSDAFRSYQKQVVENAKALASGLMAEDVDLVAGGTDNHMLLLDLRNLNLTGKTAQECLESAGITTNKNAIPFDPLGPAVTSGIRIGTPAVTSRGMGPPEMARIAELIARVLKNPTADSTVQAVRKAVLDLCRAFPVYSGFSPKEPNSNENHG
jgi:glycine hydroxymethyltransferase